MSEEELYELVLIDYTCYRIIDKNKRSIFNSQHEERRNYLVDIYFKCKRGSDYNIYYRMIHLGLTKQEIFDMTLKERITYLYLFYRK